MNLMGYRVPAGVPSPPFNQMSREERTEAFGKWCSTYYAHPFYHSSDPTKRERNVANLMPLPPSKDQEYRPATTETFSQEVESR